MHGGGSSGTGSKKKATINVIPLIDVIMFLLATFVLFTLSMNKSTGPGGITLNEGKTGIDFDPNKAVTVSLNTQGEIFWEKEKQTWDNFLLKLIDYRNREDPVILINFDENANFGQAMSALDEIRKTEKIKVLISTKLPTPGRS
jgi:biopolymer transport protein ExbD